MKSCLLGRPASLNSRMPSARLAPAAVALVRASVLVLTAFVSRMDSANHTASLREVKLELCSTETPLTEWANQIGKFLKDADAEESGPAGQRSAGDESKAPQWGKRNGIGHHGPSSGRSVR